MRFVIILLLSLCTFLTKAHDHTCQVKNSRLVGYVCFDEKSEQDTYVYTENIGDVDELVIVIDDDDNDTVSARKYTLLVKSPIVQFYSHLFPDVHQNTPKSQFNCYRSSVITFTDRYITQRVLRI